MSAEYSVEEVRARFEAWAAPTYGIARHSGLPDQYAAIGVQCAWAAWQAAYAEHIKADEGAVPVAGWEYHKRGPTEGGDQRCLCTIEQDAMMYVGIAIWTSELSAWFQNGAPLNGRVLAWQRLPNPCMGRWVRGQLLHAVDATSKERMAEVRDWYARSAREDAERHASHPPAQAAQVEEAKSDLTGGIGLARFHAQFDDGDDE